MARMAVALLVALWAATAAAGGPHYRIEVAGLACPFCAYGIEKRLGAVDGVERVEVDIGEGVVLVTMEDGATLHEATARRAVDEAGFTLDGFAPTGDGGGR